MLADLTDIAPIASSAVDLDRLHRDVTELLIRCAIEAGQLDGIVGLAAERVAADPLAEPAVLLQRRALAATGRARRGS